MGLLSTVPFLYRVIFIGAVFASAGAFGWFKGCEHVQAKWDSQKQAEAVLVSKVQAQNAEIVAKHDEIAQQIGDEYATKLTQLQETYNEKTSTASSVICRMRGPASGGTVILSSHAKASSPAHETTKNGLVNTLPLDCAETTQQLESLQQWVNQTVNSSR